ncbi:MAG: FHA domain-containing protein [Phycisphaerae bacterium]
MTDTPTGGSQLPARRPGGGVRAHLEAKAGPEKGETLRLAPGVTVIGRDPACDIQLSEPAISRQHCRIDHAGDQWVLRNLSSNGTRVKRKEIEEHVLSHGDEIRIGAKTRLVFVLEERVVAEGARPQFRPRTAEGEAVGAAEEEEAEAAEDEEETPSLFKRRRGLFIGLGAYLGLLIIGGILAAVYLKGSGGGPGRDDGLPRLSLDARIIPPGGSRPLRIDRTSPTGIWCVNDRGEQILVPHEALKTGEARRVPGIRQAIDVQYLTPDEFQRRKRRGDISPNYPYVLEHNRSRAMAERLKREALEAHLVSDMPGNEEKLFYAVRYFQRALAHYGMRFLPDPHEDKIRQEATKKLINRIHDLYREAVRVAKAGDFGKAIAAYEKILDYVPERENIIYHNVSRRLTDVRRRARAARG